MAINKSALKQERQSKKRREANRVIKSKVHTAYKNLDAAMDLKNKEAVDNKLKIYMNIVDKAVKRNIFHVNKGARNKSRIMKKINKIFTIEKSA